MEKLNKREVEVLREYAAQSMNAKKAAEKLYMSAPNVHHVLNRVKAKTGKDPKNMRQLIELVEEAGKDA